MKTPFMQLNLSSIEHVCVEYHLAESHFAVLLMVALYKNAIKYSSEESLRKLDAFTDPNPHCFI
jgi:hypothetical protein